MSVDGGCRVRLPVTDRRSPVEDHYRVAASVRAFERTLLDLFACGLLSGTTHTCLGQEVAQVGITAALDRDRDCVFSNHRGHGHFLSYCGEAELLLAEVMGRPNGLCLGRGGSQHLQHRNFYSNGIQGGIVGNAAGVALAEKLAGTGAVTLVWIGDGTFGEGLVYETMNIAALWGLPLVIVAECNGIAQTTPTERHMAGSVEARCAAFGIEACGISGLDVGEAVDVAATVIDATRADRRPRCLISRAARLGPHSKGDDTRDADLIAAAWRNDPLANLRRRIGDERADAVDAEVAAAMAGLLAHLEPSA